MDSEGDSKSYSIFKHLKTLYENSIALSIRSLDPFHHSIGCYIGLPSHLSMHPGFQSPFHRESTEWIARAIANPSTE